MDFLIQLVMELAIEGAIEGSKSNKIPKPIRYILLSLVALFFVTAVGLIAFFGVIMFREKNILAGVFATAISIAITLGSVTKCRQYINFKK